MKIQDGDREAIQVIREELAKTERWLLRAENSFSDDYIKACERVIYWRQCLGLPAPE